MQKLVRELSKLPTIGEKSATRLAYHLVNSDKALAASLASALSQAASSVVLCESCFFLSETPRCSVCADPSRDASLLCVVEKPMDVLAIERMGEFRGMYHVLHGLWSPLRGKGPESIKVKELLERVAAHSVKEVILATSCTVEGDATSLYIARLLSERSVACSRVAQGMPKGGELEFADDVTLSRALSGRSLISA